MRTRLEGTQASGEDELHIQEANVAEVSYGEPVNGERFCRNFYLRRFEVSSSSLSTRAS